MSLTLKGIIVLLLASLLHSADLDVPNERLTDFVELGAMLVGAGLAWYGRVRKGDVDWLGFRK